MRQWIRRSFRNRVFASVLLITLVPIFVCNILTMLVLVNHSNRELFDEGEYQLNACADTMDALCAQMEKIVEDMSHSTVVRSALRNDSNNSRALFQKLNQSAYFIRDYCRVDICMADGRCAYSTDEDLPEDYDPNWGALWAASKAKVMVYPADTKGNGLCAARSIRNSDGQTLGYLVFTMTRANIDALLAGKYSASNDLYIVDSVWRIVYSSRSADSAILEQTLREEHLAGKRLTGGDAGECNFYALPSQTTGLTLLLRQPVTYAQRVTNTFFGLSLFLSITSFIMCLMYAFWLSENLSEPVDKMSDAMSRISAGQLDTVVDVDREDELGKLSQSFNIMNKRYRENLRQSVARQKELDETQVRMMQAQLNPHFLYNTLDSIKWMGITNHVPGIADIASNLAVLLRASISGDEFITVEQELDFIEHYLQIQYIRFEDRFTCEIDVDWQHQMCMIPKLCLQPLVENAIVHGVADMEEGYIKVTSRTEGDMMVLSVTDNGCGIPAEVLERLNNPGETRPQRHLGLYNVNRILKLHYGPDSGLHAMSAEGQGSTVEIRLPMTAKAEKTMEGEKANAESSDRG